MLNVLLYREISSDGWINSYIEISNNLLLGKNYLQWQLNFCCNRGAWLVVNRSDFDAIPDKYKDDFRELLKIKLVYLTDDDKDKQLKDFIEMLIF